VLPSARQPPGGGVVMGPVVDDVVADVGDVVGDVTCPHDRQ